MNTTGDRRSDGLSIEWSYVHVRTTAGTRAPVTSLPAKHSLMRAARDSLAYLPLLSVLALAVAVAGYAILFPCNDALSISCMLRNPLTPFATDVRQLDLVINPGAFAAHSASSGALLSAALVAFVVVAGAAVWVSGLSAKGSFSDSQVDFPRVRLLVLLSILVIILTYQFPPWILLDGVLAPFLDLAPGDRHLTPRLATLLQHGVGSLAWVAGVFVVMAASAALLTSRKEPGSERATDLVTQWRRLSWSLYAGATLLVTAIVLQATLYAWPQVMSDSATATHIARVRSLKLGLDSARLRLENVNGQLLAYTNPEGDLEVGSAYVESLLLAKAAQVANLNELTHAIAVDTLTSMYRLAELNAAVEVAGKVIVPSVTRGVGIIFTLMLAAMYLPAAAILTTRARNELSRSVSPPVKDSPEWKGLTDIQVSFGGQWRRFAAVLSPLLATGGTALFLKLIE